MEPVELRPLSLGELLDRTFTLYRGHFWLFVGILAIPTLFSIPFNFVYFSARGNSFFVNGTLAAFSGGVLVFIVIFGVLLLFVYAVAMGAATFAVSESYLGHDATVRGSYTRVAGKFWRIIGVALNIVLRFFGIVMLAVFGAVAAAAGAAALVATPFSRGPGRGNVMAIIIGLVVFLAVLVAVGFSILLTLRYAVAIPALLLEGLGVFAAIRRSVLLTRGRRGHIFLAIVLAAIVGYVGVIVFQVPFYVAMAFSLRSGALPPWLLMASAVATAAGGAITGPLTMIVIVLCYYDARIRKEAFDLQFMMSSLDQPATAAGMVTPA